MPGGYTGPSSIAYDCGNGLSGSVSVAAGAGQTVTVTTNTVLTFIPTPPLTPLTCVQLGNCPTPVPTPTPTPTPTATLTPIPTSTPTGTVLAATATPRITLPPTNTIDEQAPISGGSNLGLILLVFTGLMTVLGLLTPVPERVRRRDRRG